MTGVQPTVVALLRDREAVARLGEALRPGVPDAPPHAGATVLAVHRVDALRAALVDRPHALVVVEQRDADGTPTDETVRAIRERCPAVVVLGYVALRRGVSSEVLAFARAGVHELIAGGIDDMVVALRAALTQAARRSTTDRLLAEITPLVPRPVLPLIRYCLEHAAEATSIADVARAIGVARQTLVTRTRAARLPSPRELATWCRLLVAAQHLVDTGRVDQAALALDFPSSNGFRNVLRRYTGLAVSDVLRGGVPCVLAAFRTALERARTEADEAPERRAAHLATI